jgi:Flp pilus assembly pilin Flp
VTDRRVVLAVRTLAATQNRLFASLRRDDGQTFVEYALVLLVIALVVAGASLWSPLGPAITSAVSKVTTAFG